MIIFYTNRSGGPIVQKVSIMLHEIGISYTAIPVDFGNDDESLQEVLKINPNKTIPVIKDEDTGVSVFESGAILYYLAQKSGMFLPHGLPERAEIMQWLVFEAANLGAVMGELYYYVLKTMDEIADEHMQRYKDKVAHYCTMLDNKLAQSEYLCGEYSIVDMAFYPWSVLLEDLAEINLNDYPHLTNWIKIIGDRQAVQAAS